MARPGGQILPVDWQKVVEGTDTTSNWRIMAGDRIFIRHRSAPPAAAAPTREARRASLPPSATAADAPEPKRPTYTYTVPFQTYQYKPGQAINLDPQSDSASVKKSEVLTELLNSRVHERESLKKQVAEARSNLPRDRSQERRVARRGRRHRVDEKPGQGARRPTGSRQVRSQGNGDWS